MTTIHWRVPINLMIKGAIAQPRVIRCDFTWECVKNQGVKISCESHTPWLVRCHHNIYFIKLMVSIIYWNLKSEWFCGNCGDGKYLEAQNSDRHIPEVEETTNFEFLHPLLTTNCGSRGIEGLQRRRGSSFQQPVNAGSSCDLPDIGNLLAPLGILKPW